ncbi:hypothetical protein CC1G_15686 [Coprinopsis cinerea okayama7|uniref:Uncharacterized protein n=1 Tax=Coprinopsis cinerea (strain Okayama-7 / 130 / ATCC MYA-4618 / FGSC 9003) TaxID=240176 RepID=D6RQE7_COPC7|nr:hypothetical protein CC1G_15686 [Coprinopsis cinerea okayama7\|eukprot:XP_002910257.1 hypothetical protein CC1G_15686 [Coprinopsis cinerea okayama7\
MPPIYQPDPSTNAAGLGVGRVYDILVKASIPARMPAAEIVRDMINPRKRKLSNVVPRFLNHKLKDFGLSHDKARTWPGVLECIDICSLQTASNSPSTRRTLLECSARSSQYSRASASGKSRSASY